MRYATTMLYTDGDQVSMVKFTPNPTETHVIFMRVWYTWDFIFPSVTERTPGSGDTYKSIKSFFFLPQVYGNPPFLIVDPRVRRDMAHMNGFFLTRVQVCYWN